MNIPARLAQELSLTPHQVQSALELFAEGATVPFIARYRKEKTGEMDEIQLRDLLDRFTYLTELEARKSTILDSIQSQGKLTPELEKQITNCLNKTELEDLYLPYKPKRRTRAMIARERGLEPLTVWIKAQNVANVGAVNLNAEAEKYLNPENGITTAAQALAGASDILAEEVADQAKHRSFLREWLTDTGLFVAKISDKLPEGSTQFEMYRSYQSKVKSIQPHNLLALFRGETENIISFDLTFDEEQVLGYLSQQEIKTKTPELRQFYLAMLKDAFSRLMKTSLIGEIRSQCKLTADIASIRTFESNLRELLLSAPAGMKPTLAIDPGFRSGCKVSVLDQTGKFLEYQAIFPHTGDYKREQAKVDLKKLIAKYQVSLIAIGNGTAGRETDDFVTEILAEIEAKPVKVMVNESGASIYSASPVAISEFPDLDITVRGAISIGRRLQDPLAELVKIDPKSIGVGQYQHDVDQKLLKKQLDETVESCVNYVGVDLNTASKELLTFVSGINATIANNIVQYRNENGIFKDRKALLKVAKLGPKAFEQAAGFLRIRDGKNALDNTAVHPERYALVNAIAKDLGIPLTDCKTLAQQLSSNLRKYVSAEVGEPTLRDIVAELEKPGRDPRAEFKYATFRSDIKEISDLRPGLELEGVITNVVAFGAFVDIGVHQDGLVHVSQLADRFVSDPTQVVKVGQVVKVTVVEVNAGLKRIALSMRSGGGEGRSGDVRKPADKPQAGKPQAGKPQGKPQVGKPQGATSEPTSSEPATLADLQARFGKKR
jgi:protein Tex